MVNRVAASDSVAAARGLPAVRLLRAAMLVSVAVVLVATLFAAGDEPIVGDWIYNVGVFSAAGLCLLRARAVSKDRTAWRLIGLALLAFGLADVVWAIELDAEGAPPYPGLSDGLYILFYPLSVGGLVALVRSREGGISRSAMADAGIGALAAASLLAVFALPVAEEQSGDTAATLVNFAYPVGGMLVLGALTALAFIDGAWRGRLLWYLVAGLVLFVVADTIYLSEVNNGTYTVGEWIDPLWLVGMACVAGAAWQRPEDPDRSTTWAAIDPYLLAALATPAIAILLVDHYDRLDEVAVVLSTLTLIAVTARFGFILAENRRLAGETATSAARYRALVETAAEAIVTFGADGRVQSVNARFTEMLGYEPEEVIGGSAFELLPEGDRRAEAEDRLAAGDRAEGPLEVEVLRRDGSTIWVLVNANAIGDEGEPDRQPEGYVAMFSDITERKRFEGRLEEMATHDPMTGLLNRRRLDAELERELASARRHGDEGALLMIDLDGFKRINDRFGHRAGDDALIAISAALSGRLRSTDLLARVGGDEFVAYLPRTDAASAADLAEALLETVRGTGLGPGAGDERLTASIGIAPIHGPSAPDAEHLIATADKAMYAAKAAGRDRVEVAEPVGASAG